MPDTKHSDFQPPDDLDAELLSLVILLNQTGYVRTIGSCAGYSYLGAGEYRRHRLVEDANPYLTMEPSGDTAKFASLQAHLSKRLANAHTLGILPSDTEDIPPDVMDSLTLYRQVDAEHLFWRYAPVCFLHGPHNGYVELGEFDLRRMGIPRRMLTGRDVLKVWRLLELAAREFVGHDAASDSTVPLPGVDAEEDVMALIPAGEFQMGDDGRNDESPIHTVFVDAFCMDRCAVTNAEYGRFLQATGHPTPKFWGHPCFGAPEQPAIGVSWYDAVAYCDWAGKRLPTEAEWERAAGGGLVGNRYPWGDTWEPGHVSHNGFATTPVGIFPPNSYGLHDMVGNVWEWCADWYKYGYYARSPERNPTGPLSGSDQMPSRVIRGGSWLSPMSNLRVASRSARQPAETWYCLGFRCARDA